MARINAKLGFVTVVEKEEEESLDVNEAMMEDTINVVSKFETEYVTTVNSRFKFVTAHLNLKTESPCLMRISEYSIN